MYGDGMAKQIHMLQKQTILTELICLFEKNLLFELLIFNELSRRNGR